MQGRLAAGRRGLRRLPEDDVGPLQLSSLAESRAEVPIVGRLARQDGTPLLISGQVDRLAVTPDAVIIADYKTNRPAPRSLVDVPDSYVTQLALYRAVLATLYPARALRALLVWTDVPDFMEIPASLLDASLARVTLG